MPLQKQKMFVKFGQGIDTKTEEKHVVPGKLLELENGVIKKSGRTDKRFGTEIISSLKMNGEPLTDASSNAVFNDELLQYNKQKLYSYSESNNKWADKGSCISASVTTAQSIKTTGSQTEGDYATTGSIGLYAYLDSRDAGAGLRVTIFDEATQTQLISDYLLTGPVDVGATQIKNIKCVSFGDSLYVFCMYLVAGAWHLYGARIVSYYLDDDLILPRIEGLISQNETGVAVNTAHQNYDIIANENVMVFVYNNQSSASQTLGFLDADLNVITGTYNTHTIAGAATSCNTIVEGDDGRLFVLWANTSDGLRAAIFNRAGDQLVAPYQVVNYTATEILHITGIETRDQLGIQVFYHVAQAATYNHFINRIFINNQGGGDIAPHFFLRGVGLWGKAFAYNFDSELEDISYTYVPISYASTLQNTYFIARNTDDANSPHPGEIVAKMQYSTGIGHAPTRLLTTVTAETANKFTFAIFNTDRLVSENNNLFSLQGICKTSIDFDAQDQFNSIQLGNNLHIVGGVLSMYDGQNVVEHGFHLYPEILTITESGSSSIGAGDYQYVAVYEWTDNFGQIHRSAPSVPVTFSSAGSKVISVPVTTLRLTQKSSDNNRSEISVVLYRTEEGPGDIFYRQSSVSSPTYNSIASDTVTFTDSTIDTAIISHEILYTTGNVLEHIAPPSCKYIRTYKNRIFLAGLEDPNEIWYSKIHSTGEAVGFNNNLVQNIPSEDGNLSAVFELDDKFIYFKKDKLFITYGDGPDNTGGGQPFAVPQLVTSDAGCENNNSLVRMPNGIMFKSRKGIYSLDSSLSLKYVGKDVDKYNVNTVTSACLLSDNNEVRFSTEEGPTLIYNYYEDQWYTFAPQRIVDAVVWNNQYTFVNTDGDFYREVSGIFTDAGGVVRLKAVTGWIAMDSIGGFQRLYKIAVIGDYKSPHKCRISVGYDFSPDFSENHIFDSASALSPSTYGSDSPYGSGSPYGGKNTSLRYVIGPKIQKCQAFRVMIEDLTVAVADGGTYEGFNIAGLTLLIGVKGQVGKFGISQKIARS